MTRRETLSLFTGLACAATSPVKASKAPIEPFTIPYDRDAEADLKRRLRSARWADAVTNDWMYGTEREFLRSFTSYWAERYEWERRVAELNAVLPQFRAVLDGFGIHFLHFRSSEKGAVPLLLMNGWPSSFVEYLQLAPRLTGGAPAFHVVLPALPGFGYSDRPVRPYQVEPHHLFPKLMQCLGYESFLVAGTDIGSGIATRIALYHPKRVIGAHIGTVAERPVRSGDAHPSADEIAYHERDRIWDRDEGGYQVLQRSKPQTLAFALADSPLGLASWILEKFRGWSDCDGDPLTVFPHEMLADNLNIYWMTNTIGSSVRYYYDAVRLRPSLTRDDFVRVPTAVGMWPKDIAVAPRELADRLYNVQRYTLFPKGGHFPAWEEPELYAADLRAFVSDDLG